MAINRDKIRQSAQKFVQKKKYARAIAEYQKLVRDDPNDARTLLKIGDLQARMHGYEEAIATYDRVGEFYFSRGFALKAVAVYKQIRALVRQQVPHLSKKYIHITPKLAEIYTQLNLTSDALAAYDEMAAYLQSEGREVDAIEVYRQMVAVDPQNPLPHLRLAEACCRVHALDDAVNAFWHAGHLLLESGRRDDALKVIERILHFREDPEYARLAAQLYLDRNQPQDGLHALAKLQVCFQSDPKDLNTLGLLGRAFTSIGQEAKACEVYKEMARLARDGGDAEMYRGLVEHLEAVAPDDLEVRALVEEAAVWPGSRAMPTVQQEAKASEHLEELPLEEELEPLIDAEQLDPPTDVVVVEDLEAAEELDAADSFDAQAHTQKALVDAASFRKLGLLPQALEALNIAAELDPQNPKIHSELADIGEDAADLQTAADARAALARLLEATSDRAEAPLPTYQLDSSPSIEVAEAYVEGDEAAFSESDDPFDSLPSFPLEGSSETAEPAAPPSNRAPAASSGEGNIDDVLEEIEFFIARGMPGEAGALVDAALTAAPNHPLLLDYRRELQAGTTPSSAEPHAAGMEAAPDSESADVFDIAASLEALDELDSGPAEGSTPAAEDVDVDAIFEKFKAGVKEQISESDSATHYDLGVAYKEMGLLSDAISEFQLAAHDPKRACMCWAMVGLIQMEQERYREAAAAYEEGLKSQHRTPDQTVTLLYDLAGALELTGDTLGARARLEELVKLDGAYRDATERLAALQAS